MMPGKVALQVGRVPALDDGIREECEVVAHENSRAKADAYGEALVMAITEPHGVLVAAVGAAEREEAEIP
jgi:NAD(P)H-nitrite reductase large subunit